MLLTFPGELEGHHTGSATGGSLACYRSPLTLVSFSRLFRLFPPPFVAPPVSLAPF